MLLRHKNKDSDRQTFISNVIYSPAGFVAYWSQVVDSPDFVYHPAWGFLFKLVFFHESTVFCSNLIRSPAISTAEWTLYEIEITQRFIQLN